MPFSALPPSVTCADSMLVPQSRLPVSPHGIVSTGRPSKVTCASSHSGTIQAVPSQLPTSTPPCVTAMLTFAPQGSFTTITPSSLLMAMLNGSHGASSHRSAIASATCPSVMHALIFAHVFASINAQKKSVAGRQGSKHADLPVTLTLTSIATNALFGFTSNVPPNSCWYTRALCTSTLPVAKSTSINFNAARRSSSVLRIAVAAARVASNTSPQMSRSISETSRRL